MTDIIIEDTPRRARFSPDTHHIAYFSRKPISPSDQMNVVLEDDGEAAGRPGLVLPQGTAHVTISCPVSGHAVPLNTPCFQNSSGQAEMAISSTASLGLPGPAMYTQGTVTLLFQTCKHQACAASAQPFEESGHTSNPPHLPIPWR